MFSKSCLQTRSQDADVPLSSISRASKVRGTFLPQEYELAKFISDVENPHESWSTATPACEWDNVKCDDEGEVIDISWSYQGLLGTLHWEHLPRSVKFLDVSYNQLSGTLEFSALPPGLEKLWVHYNLFSGEVYFEHLPTGISVLNISRCDFSGFVDLSCLQHSSLAKAASGFDIRNNPKLQGSVPRNIVPTNAWWGIPNSWFTKG